MVSIARKNLFQDKTRLLISIGGVAFAVLLIIVLLSVYHGWSGKVKSYIESFQADLWVAQAGTSDLFHSVSILPLSQETEIKKIEGVKETSIYRGRAMVIDLKGEEVPVFLVGFDPKEARGGPLRMIEGKKDIQNGEIVIDQVFAHKNDLSINDTLRIGEENWTIVGISEGGDMVMYQNHFVTQQDAAEIFEFQDKVNFFLVKTEAGETISQVAKRIQDKIPGLKVFEGQEFIEKNNKVIVQSFLPIFLVLVIIGFLIGVVVIGLTIYAATTEKSREYGVLKAIGASSGQLYQVIFQQALISGVLGYLLGLILAVLAIQTAKSYVPEFVTQLRIIDLIWVFGVSLAMSFTASYIPIRKINQIDPALVFKA